MISTDRTALICDLAETYHVYSLESLPVKTVAALAAGLRENSRIKMKMRGAELPGDPSFWLTLLIDRVTDVLAWFGAFENTKRPTSAVELLLGEFEHEQKQGALKGYSSAEEFDAARSKFMR